MVSEFAILAQKRPKTFFGLHNLFLVGLGQVQQQHPAVHIGGVSRWTHETLHMRDEEKKRNITKYVVSGLKSKHADRFSVSQ